jgi:hypothetical protein
MDRKRYLCVLIVTYEELQMFDIYFIFRAVCESIV